MTVDTAQIDETYLPIYSYIPKEDEELREFLSEQFRRISNAVNVREIGWFLNQQLLSGQQFIPGVNNTQAFRSIFRTVIVFGTLPNATTKSVAHNITVNASFSLINMYLSATDPVNFVGFSLQYWSKASADILLSYSATNIIVTTASDYSAYTTSFVIFEFIQEL